MSIAAEKLITAIGEKAAEYKRLSCKDILDLCEAYRCIVEVKKNECGCCKNESNNKSPDRFNNI